MFNDGKSDKLFGEVYDVYDFVIDFFFGLQTEKGVSNRMNICS